ncbi:MAG TPA: SUF system NifU family Fe-S cluster assembly protein [Acidobacteriota bacterium]|nr:SUF system NifU family Fe-S cluster assembly protein [Acidobacteriota bacterium]
MSSSLNEMYRDIILDHYRAPRGRKPLEKSDISSGGQNPACGDEIDMEIELENDVLKDIHVDCRGCAISVASGSMLAEAVKGRTFEEVGKLAEVVRSMLKGEDADLPEELEDLEALQGVRKFPVRIKCALLAWITLIEGLKSYQSGQPAGRTDVTTEDSE